VTIGITNAAAAGTLLIALTTWFAVVIPAVPEVELPNVTLIAVPTTDTLALVPFVPRFVY